MLGWLHHCRGCRSGSTRYTPSVALHWLVGRFIFLEGWKGALFIKIWQKLHAPLCGWLIVAQIPLFTKVIVGRVSSIWTLCWLVSQSVIISSYSSMLLFHALVGVYIVDLISHSVEPATWFYIYCYAFWFCFLYNHSADYAQASFENLTIKHKFTFVLPSGHNKELQMQG